MNIFDSFKIVVKLNEVHLVHILSIFLLLYASVFTLYMD